MQYFNPESLSRPKGYNHGVRSGPLLFIAAQPAYGKEAKIEGRGSVVKQFEVALKNVLAIVREAGGAAEAIIRLSIFVTDMADYKARAREVGEVYRALMGKHYPAITCLEVGQLYEEEALVEIEATAVL